MNHVPQVMVATLTDLRTLPAFAPLRATGPVLVLVGGAGGMDQQHLDAARTLLRDHLVGALDQWQALVVDGGTDSGVMRLIGRERHTAKARFPLVGVAARGTVAHRGQADPTVDTELEPHHTLVVLVPGTDWGDESPWLSAVASSLADSRPSVTLLINGGRIAYDDVAHSLAAGRPVVVLAGSGRTSDAISAGRSGESADTRAAQLGRHPLVHIAQLDRPDDVIRLVEQLLEAHSPGS